MFLAHAPESSPWTWQPHPEVWLAVGGLAVAYVVALRRLAPGSSRPGEPVATWRHKACFAAGLLLLWIFSDWPVHTLAEGHMFSVHMVQHLVYAFIVPPLLLLGMPRWLLRKILAPAPIFKGARVLTSPLVALVIFNATIVLLHWPLIVDLQVSSEAAHAGIHALLLGAALLMWWPVVGPLPEMPKLHEPVRMFYLFVQSIVPTVPASFLTFARGSVYRVYDTMAHPLGWEAVTDQTVAGLIMKLGGGVLLWSIIVVLFFKWYAEEERRDAGELSWEEFESELRAMDLRR
jgi:putative membrane protein